jgi:hypothetical protein
MMAVFIFGLGAITLLMGMMKAVLHFDVGIIIAFTLLTFLTMLLLEGVFIRLLLSRKRGPEAAGNAGVLKGQATKELDVTEVRALPDKMPSVTEHTTRTFEPAHLKRTSK